MTMSGRRDSSRGDMGESIRQALGKHVKILHKVAMKLEKGGGDRTDNRVLVFTPHRLFVMTAKVGFNASLKEDEGVTHLLRRSSSPHFFNPFIVGAHAGHSLSQEKVGSTEIRGSLERNFHNELELRTHRAVCALFTQLRH